MGFTVFAIEASMPEAFRLNDYVLHGKGDPKELIRGMYFWTWNTQEVLDMILWMRDFNESGKGRIEFLGFDMQEPKVAAENVRSFVEKSDPGFTQSLDQRLRQTGLVPPVSEGPGSGRRTSPERGGAGRDGETRRRRIRGGGAPGKGP